MIKECGVQALNYLTHSSNPRVVGLANKLLTRIRMVKLRTAARLAGQLAVLRSKEEGGVDYDALREGMGGGGQGNPNGRLPPIKR